MLLDTVLFHPDTHEPIRINKPNSIISIIINGMLKSLTIFRNSQAGWTRWNGTDSIP